MLLFFLKVKSIEIFKDNFILNFVGKSNIIKSVQITEFYMRGCPCHQRKDQMQLLKSDSSHKRTSKFGDFELIPDVGWEISGAFIDHGSQLLVVGVRCTDKSKWSHDGSATFIPARQYVIDVKIPKLLSGEDLDNYFSYGPIETYSSDGRYKIITTRRRGG